MLLEKQLDNILKNIIMRCKKKMLILKKIVIFLLETKK